MPHVEFTGHLRRYFPELAPCEVGGATVAEVVAAVNNRFPGLAAYLVDERGALRQHVNLFVGGAPIADRVHLSDPVAADDTVFVLQALSGG